MSTGLTVYSKKDALEQKRRLIAEGWPSAAIVWKDDENAYKVIPTGLKQEAPPPKTLETSRVLSLPPEEAQPYLEAELQARELERIGKGISPKRMIGTVRWLGPRGRGVPLHVAAPTREAIGVKEQARFISAQETLPKLQDDLSNLKAQQAMRGEQIYRELAQLRKMEEAEVKALREQGLPPGEGFIDVQKYKRLAQSLHSELKHYDKEVKRLDKRIKDEEGKIEERGAYTPAQRTGIVVAEKLSQALAAEQRLKAGIIRTSAPHIGHVRKGMIKSIPRARPGAHTVFGRGSEQMPAISEFGAARIAQTPSARIAGLFDLSKLRDERYEEK